MRVILEEGIKKDSVENQLTAPGGKNSTSLVSVKHCTGAAAAKGCQLNLDAEEAGEAFAHTRKDVMLTVVDGQWSQWRGLVRNFYSVPNVFFLLKV